MSWWKVQCRLHNRLKTFISWSIKCHLNVRPRSTWCWPLMIMLLCIHKNKKYASAMELVLLKAHQQWLSIFVCKGETIYTDTMQLTIQHNPFLCLYCTTFHCKNTVTHDPCTVIGLVKNHAWLSTIRKWRLLNFFIRFIS